MKITRRQLRKLISEARLSADTQGILEAHASLSYFYGYASKLLAHIRTSASGHFPSRIIGDIDISLSGIVEEVLGLRAHAGHKIAKITGTSTDKSFLEFRSISQEAKDNAFLKIRESFGDAYAHLLKLAYDGNDVLGTMALVDAYYIVSPDIQVEWRFDYIESHLQNDDYLNVMDSIT